MRPRLLVRLLLAAALVGAGFAWGFTSHRWRTFPYHQVRELAVRFGVAQRDVTPGQSVKSRSFEIFEALRTLGYVEGTFDADRDRSGVFKLDRSLAWDSVRFYSSVMTEEARLIDLEGTALHTWRYDTGSYWGLCRLLDNGDILVVVSDIGLMRLDAASRLIWSVGARTHHAMDVFDGVIWVLTREERRIPWVHPIEATLDEFVSRYTLDGTLIDRTSVLDLLHESDHRYLLPSIRHIDAMGGNDKPLDLLHLNHLEVLDGSAASLGPAFERGNVLLCYRNINLIVIYDPDTREIVWAWGPTNLVFPHHPQMLPGGSLLLFNNGTEQSEVLEVDPLTFDVTWRYAAGDFFSRTRGSVQRLPNGNTLVTESDSGYVFEVTIDGRRVWQFANPDISLENKRGAIYRMTAHAKDETPFLADLAAGRPIAGGG